MWWSGCLDADEAAIVDAIDQLCAAHVTKARCAHWDDTRTFPADAMMALAAGGWAALAVPTAHGGAGASARELAVAHQSIARHSLAVAQAYYSLWVLGAEAISRLGTEDQRVRWLPSIAAGEAYIAFALTEPGSGSDAAALRTSARAAGNAYVVSGQKVFITGAGVSQRIVTAVRTGPSQGRHGGISLLMIDPSLSGVRIRPIRKIGLNAVDLCEVFFDDVRVPADELLGPVDDAWRALGAGLASERLYLAAISVGALCDLIGQVLEYARDRTTFGRPIAGHQLIGAKIVRMRVAADAAAGLVRAAADLVDASSPHASAAASVAKLHATEAYVTATRDATQIFGGYGYTEEYAVARHYRDAKYLEIGGGTSEIQTIVIGRSMGLPL
jgi:alkylation response protein AidB-like acyl-CoA dehydrogenase